MGIYINIGNSLCQDLSIAGDRKTKQHSCVIEKA